MRLSGLVLCLLVATSVGLAQGEPASSGATLKAVVRGLNSPVAIASTPAEPSKLFIVEREGIVRVVDSGKLSLADLLDIEDILSPEENPGLSSIAFPPDYSKSKLFYVTYTDKQGDTIIGRFPTKLPKSAREEDLRVTLKIVQPHPHAHRSSLAFGPDSYLYIALGDAPPQRGASALAQNSKSLFGKILRIDVSNPETYKIPSDNPFSKGVGGAPEVWASGFQSPSHLSFDSKSSRVFVVDSGSEFQEIDLLERGKNYGWPISKGGDCGARSCDTGRFTAPLYSDSGKVAGGFVYTGDRYQALKGTYIFADSASSTVYKLINEGGTWTRSSVAHSPTPIVTLGQGGAGEIFIATQDGALAELIL